MKKTVLKFRFSKSTLVVEYDNDESTAVVLDKVLYAKVIPNDKIVRLTFAGNESDSVLTFYFDERDETMSFYRDFIASKRIGI